jgi:hypothetical protein
MYKRRGLSILGHFSQLIILDSHAKYSTMDFFASLFTITSNIPEHELEPSAPIDADLGGGNFSACNVA